jgi:acyl carrier protein
MSDVAERVKKVVAEVLKVDRARVVESARFVEDLGASSMESVELVAAFEEEFDIDMDEQKALAVKSVGHAAEFIEAILAGEG